MPFIRDYVWMYEATTTDAGITVPMPAYAQNDLILVFAMGDTGTPTWGCSGYTQLVARNNTTSNICYYKIATASEGDIVITSTVNETYNACAITIGDVDTTYPFGNAAVYSDTTSAASTRDAMAQITTTRDNALVIYYSSASAVTCPCFIEGPVHHLTGGDGSAEAMGVGWAFQKTAGSTSASIYCSKYAATGGGAEWVIQIWPPSGGATVIPPYIATDNCALLDLIHGTSGYNGNTGVAATADTNFGTTLGGLTANDATVAAAADIGINSFHSMAGLTNVAYVNRISGAELVFASGNRPNVGTKNILCHAKFATPANAQRFPTIGSGRGLWFGMRSNTTGTSDHKIWQVHGVDSSWSFGAHVPIIINSGAGNAKETAGSLTTSAITALGFWNSGIANLTNQLSVGMAWLMDSTVLAGGYSSEPIGLEDIVRLCGISKERVSVLQQGVSQMLCLQHIQFGNGGTNPVYLKLEYTAIEFPKQYDAASKVINYNSTDNLVGFTYYPGADDTIIHRNSVVSSPSKYFWVIHASASTSADYDFSNLTLIGAGTVTLKAGITFDGITFQGCDEVPSAGATIQNCFFNSTIGTGALSVSSAANMDLVTDCTFTGNAYGIRLTNTSADTYDFVGIQFSGNTKDIYVAATSGTVTINVSGGGDSPTYTSAGATVTIVDTKNLTLTGLITGSDIVIYEAGTTTVIEDAQENSGTTYVYDYDATDAGSDIDVGVFKAGYVPFYIRDYTLSSSDASLPVAQVVDRAYLE